ncbi:hypothetical protein GGF31_008470 [Allomyces arbusculus]|nr:hypothetical protein GGF31_008470 [Allomyces arbusculus]
MNNVYSLSPGHSPAPSVMSSSSAPSSAKGSPPPTSPTSTLHLDQASAAPNHVGSVMGDESGRIKVFVRVRPILAHEANEKDAPVVTTDPEASHITIFDNVKKPASFVFDHVFPPATDNRAVYAQVGKPLVEACLRGFNGTLIAYGQTGTGKTTTLSASDGVIPRALRQLFRAMARDQHRFVYKVRLSYMQIYQERIYDLLATDMPDDLQDAPDLALREHPELGIFVEGLTEHAVRSINDVNAMLQLGQSRLVFAETKMNRHSSRSHAICFLTVERAPNRAFGLAASMSRTSFNSLSASSSVAGASAGLQRSASPTSPTSPVPSVMQSGSSSLRPPSVLGSNLAPPTASAPSSFFAPRPSIFYTPGEDDLDLDDDDEHAHTATEDMFAGQDPDVVVRGRLTLCDLAGSERVKKTLATGQQLNEAKDINLSLLELGNVIQALAESKKHIPFRNAALTRLLQESLGGNCLTSLIVCVSPTRKDLSETKGTLLFGFRAMRIKTHARVNVEVDHEKLAKELEEALKRKESEWAAKEQQYRAELEQLRSRAQIQAPPPPPSLPAPPGSPSQTAAPVSAGLPTDDDPMHTRYRALLDSFTTAAETLRDIAGQITSDILVADLTATQALAQLRDTCPLPAQLAVEDTVSRPASPTRSSSASPTRSRSPTRSAWGLGGIPHSTLLADLLEVYRPDLASRAGTAESITDVVRHLRLADRDAQTQVLDRLGALVPPGIARAWPRPPTSPTSGGGAGATGWFSTQLAEFRTLVQTHPADLHLESEASGNTRPREKSLERGPDSGHTTDLLPSTTVADDPDAAAELLHFNLTNDDIEEDSDLAILDAATRDTARALQSAWAVLRHLQCHSALTRAVGIFERLLVQRELDRVVAELDGASEVVARIERALGVTVEEGTGMRVRLMAVFQAVDVGSGGEGLRVRAGWRRGKEDGNGEGRRVGDAGSDGETVDDNDLVGVEKQRACGTECLIQ